MLFSRCFTNRVTIRGRICFGSIGRWGACRPFRLLAHRCPSPISRNDLSDKLLGARTIKQRYSLLASFFIDGSQPQDFTSLRNNHPMQRVSRIRVTCGQTSMFGCLENANCGAFVDFLRCNM